MTGLEALNVLARNVESLEIDTFYECKGAYQFLEKSLKALEIIKEKRVDLCILTDCDNVNEYNKSLGNFRPVEDRLTYEEFKLLKEVLE